ncbi:MAG: M23 family metallopeptidase [Candidatus Dormibacteraeota bacterium]|nr:M23 family metallopeptidase [Candidatus Dormibacteraeota bacterium]
MTSLLAARLGVLALGWRRPMLALGAVGCALPVLMAAIVVQAQAGHPTGLTPPVRTATLTQAFGCTPLEIEPWSGECPSHHFHSGVDLAAPMDTPVYAAHAGTVMVDRQRGGYGLYLVLRRDGRMSTLYGHLDLPLVRTGEQVAPGQLIALMGSSGNSTGPHLHFEVRLGGVPVDPVPLLPALGQGGGR